jgi:putative transposase
VYYEPAQTGEEQLRLMRRIDEIHLERPSYGSRLMTQILKNEGQEVNRKRVQRLMRLMQIESIAPKPNTSRASKQHPKYPYLLRNLKIYRPNQVWAADITYVPLTQGFAYLVAIMDLFSRMVLSWRVSNTLDPSFCVEALQAALERFGKPEIFNSDQGSQFTSSDFTGVLLANAITISMDGKGRFTDNIFVERLWRSVKYEDVYINDYGNVVQSRVGLGKYFVFYNTERPHQSLGYQTPEKYHYYFIHNAA